MIWIIFERLLLLIVMGILWVIDVALRSRVMMAKREFEWKIIGKMGNRERLHSKLLRRYVVDYVCKLVLVAFWNEMSFRSKIINKRDYSCSLLYTWSSYWWSCGAVSGKCEIFGFNRSHTPDHRVLSMAKDLSIFKTSRSQMSRKAAEGKIVWSRYGQF